MRYLSFVVHRTSLSLCSSRMIKMNQYPLQNITGRLFSHRHEHGGVRLTPVPSSGHTLSVDPSNVGYFVDEAS